MYLWLYVYSFLKVFYLGFLHKLFFLYIYIILKGGSKTILLNISFIHFEIGNLFYFDEPVRSKQKKLKVL
jgi:hypothetical protein